MSRAFRCEVVEVVSYDQSPEGNQTATLRLKCGRVTRRTVVGVSEFTFRRSAGSLRLRCNCKRNPAVRGFRGPTYALQHPPKGAK